MLFHIDGNSFYASCERVFRADLRHSPIAVLSNNDGLIVALCPKCKALGYRRGDVYFQIKDKMERQGVKVFSSNYTLYADMSSRMNLIYHRFAPEVEVYSIDESFLFYPAWKNADYSKIAWEIKETVTRETGIPVAVGVAPTKTLAKMCNKLAKQRGGVCNWMELDQDEELGKYPVGDVWGVGHAKTAFLKRRGITSAFGLKKYPLAAAKKYLTITGFRTVQELNGIPAIDQVERSPRQVAAVSRSFRSPVYDLAGLKAALFEYAQEAVSRIREEGLSCKYVSVFAMTNAWAEGPQYFNQLSAQLPHLSAYLPEISAVAVDLLERIFRPGYKYRKVMVMLAGLEIDKNPQYELFDDYYNEQKRLEPLMQVFDSLNERYGRGTVKLCSGIVGKKPEEEAAWEVKREFLSPRYTTSIGEIPVVY